MVVLASLALLGACSGSPSEVADAAPEVNGDGAGGDRPPGQDGPAGSDGGVDAGDAGTGPGLWVLGYWAVWQATTYPLDKVAWSAMSHAALSFVGARAPVAPTSKSPYETLDTDNAVANLGATGMADFAKAAHKGGTKALMSLGGGGAGAGFAKAASAANRAQFVADVLAACAGWGYDGVDLDWEDQIVYADFKALVKALRAAAPAGFLVTVPIGAVNLNLGIDAGAKDLWGSVHGDVDQLNVMTYTGSGNYPGWVVWHQSPLLGQGPDHPFDVSSTLDAWVKAGVPKAKLGLGLGFYGRAVGPPVTAPLQAYGGASVYENDTVLSYGSISRYFEGKGGATYHWDDKAQAGYLSWATTFQPAWSAQFPAEPRPEVTFLTYEDPAGVASKGDWAKKNGYGGAIIWTINEGVAYPDGSDGYANPLLDAVGKAFR